MAKAVSRRRKRKRQNRIRRPNIYYDGEKFVSECPVCGRTLGYAKTGMPISAPKAVLRKCPCCNTELLML